MSELCEYNRSAHSEEKQSEEFVTGNFENHDPSQMRYSLEQPNHLLKIYEPENVIYEEDEVGNEAQFYESFENTKQSKLNTINLQDNNEPQFGSSPEFNQTMDIKSDQFNKLQSFESYVISPAMQISSDCNKSNKI